MSVTRTNPPTVRAPTGYTHGVLVTSPGRRLIMSGQVGIAPDGTIPRRPRRRSARRSPTCGPCSPHMT